MRLDCSKSLGPAILLAIASVVPAFAQSIHVEIGKRIAAIPKVCEAIAPTVIEGAVDVSALAKEASCKGSGDMLAEYTYVMEFARRKKHKKEADKEETSIYEVYIPTLTNGANARGVLLLTSRNGIPVPPDELEKERWRAGERLEKAEEEIARSAALQQAAGTSQPATGLLPLGTYQRTGINLNTLGFSRGGVSLDVRTFLNTCELTLARREQIAGRETLIFNFRPRHDARFSDKEKYIAQLGGTIWIDAQDRIVTRLVGWPTSDGDTNKAEPTTSPVEKPPAVYLEMMRLPEGVWLPRATRINGADYPKLFDRVSYESIIIYSEYKRFFTETKDVRIETPTAR
jgi:hypothetical protein